MGAGSVSCAARASTPCKASFLLHLHVADNGISPAFATGANSAYGWLPVLVLRSKWSLDEQEELLTLLQQLDLRD